MSSDCPVGNAGDSSTGNCTVAAEPALPSMTVKSWIEAAYRPSSSTTVTLPAPSLMTALVAAVIFTEKRLSPPDQVLPNTVTLTVLLVSPGAKVSSVGDTCPIWVPPPDVYHFVVTVS